MYQEHKHRLDGRIQTFPCDALEIAAQRAVLRYVTRQGATVAGVAIPTGAVTYAVYWTDRPYNIYLWTAPDGRTLGYYFNIATDTRIGPEALHWLDLEVDVLVAPGGSVRVLDEDKLPADLSPAHRGTIAEALAALRDGPALMAAVDAIVSDWRR